MQFITWLELAVSAISARLHKVGSVIVVHLMDMESSQAWQGMTIGERWPRGSNGALTGCERTFKSTGSDAKLMPSNVQLRSLFNDLAVTSSTFLN